MEASSIRMNKTKCKNDDSISNAKDEVDFLDTNNNYFNDELRNRDAKSNNNNINNVGLVKIGDSTGFGKIFNKITNQQSAVSNKDREFYSKKMKKSESNESKADTKERHSLFSFNRKYSPKHSNSPKTTVTASLNSHNSNTINNNNNTNNNNINAHTNMNTININTKTNSLTNIINSNPANPMDNAVRHSTSATTTTTAQNSNQIDDHLDFGFTEPLAIIPDFDSVSQTNKAHKFMKSSSLARFLGQTYNARKFEKEEQTGLANEGKFHTFAGRRRRYHHQQQLGLSGPYLERFRKCSKEDGECAVVAETTLDLHNLYDGSRRNDAISLEHPEEEAKNVDFSTKAMRTISRGLGKLWWRRSHSVEISTPDPEYKVCYLGNVLTGWAKGEGCVEKQLNTLWRNYTQNTKPDVAMRIKVCASGLKATTRQHGLTEYWANRITHCCAPQNYPRVFCWIYRHEGRKLKHELRCHAVLCSKQKIAQDICTTLKENLECALREFKREKILKQNARLSLANAAYENPSLPRRKILLSVGGNNYRPPLERSKSAPKLMAIEEAIGEEEGDEIEETNEPEMKSCCQKDSLYPAMTLGRRRCRRGHSIRRTGKTRATLCPHATDEKETAGPMGTTSLSGDTVARCNSSATHIKNIPAEATTEEQRHSYGSDESDDFEKLLKGHNYDTGSSLANELLPFFELQLHKQTSSSLGSLIDLPKREDEDDDDIDRQPLSLLPTINNDPGADPAGDYNFHIHETPPRQECSMLHLRRSGVCSDGEEDYMDAEDEIYFRQASILNGLHRNSMRKMMQLTLDGVDENSNIAASNTTAFDQHSHHQHQHQVQSSISSNASSTTTSTSDAATPHNKRTQFRAMDSDESGSISSGCETASTVTANQDDTSLRYRQCQLLQQLAAAEEPPPISAEEIYQRLESRLHGRHGSDATTFSSSSSITLKLGSSTPSLIDVIHGESGSGGVGSCGGRGGDDDADECKSAVAGPLRTRKVRKQHTSQSGGDDTDSDCSDESGYVEYQPHGRGTCNQLSPSHSSIVKPQPPPKPLPRRYTGHNKLVVGTTTVV